jgi:hypothetical protein
MRTERSATSLSVRVLVSGSHNRVKCTWLRTDDEHSLVGAHELDLNSHFYGCVCWFLRKARCCVEWRLVIDGAVKVSVGSRGVGG